MDRWMGVDFGDKRIGLALADDETKIATPWQITPACRKSIASSFARSSVPGINKIVVGLPVSTSGKKAKAKSASAGWIKSVTGLEVYLWDERYTTNEADALLANANCPRKKKRDALLAQIMLQDFIDAGCRACPARPLDDVLASSRL